MVDIADGSKFLVVASLYGHSSASQDPALAKKNDALLRAAALRCASFVSIPYFVCTDANTNPQTCAAWRELLDKGHITDLPADWGNGNLENTFRREGVYKGMSGSGITRIDTVLSNEVGAQMVGEIKYLWATSGANDHVGIAVRVDGARLQQKVLRAGRPIGICLDGHKYAPPAGAKPSERQKLAEDANASFGRIWGRVDGDFKNALAIGDVNESHRIWCRTCELWLYFNQGESNMDPDEKRSLERTYQGAATLCQFGNKTWCRTLSGMWTRDTLACHT